MHTRFPAFAFAFLALTGAAPCLAAETPATEAGAPPTGERLEHVEVVDRIEADGSYVRRQRQVARLTSAAAVAAYSQVGVPFLESSQEAELTRLVVIKPDGRALDLLASAPRDVAPVYPPDLPVYSDLRVLRAAVPALEIDDRIDFETTVRVRPLAAGEVWTELKLYAPERADAQSYELDVPEAMALLVWVRAGFEGTLEETRADGRRIRRWRVDGRPASAPAAGGEPDAEGFEPDVAVTSFASWEEFGGWWASLAPPETDDAVRAKAKELAGAAREPRERLRALHRYVAREIRYLSLPLGLGRYRARPPAEVMRSGLGDCKDKIRLLASLAAAAGLEVDPVLVGVQRRRRLDTVPYPDPFDHVIARARLAGEEIWLDPTSEMTPMGSLPKAVRGLPGVAVRGTSGPVRAELVTTPERLAVEAAQTVETTGAIDASGVIRARVRWTFSGDDEAVRLLFRYASNEQQRQAVEFLGDDWEGESGKIGTFTFGDPADVDAPFWVEYEAEWKMSASTWTKAWDLWIPLPKIELSAPPDAEADGEAARRDFELESVPRQRIAARIEVPEGVKVTPPVPVTAVRDFGEYRSTYRVEGRALLLERELVLKAKRVPPAKFAELEALKDLIREDRRQEFDIAAAPGLVAAPAETAEVLGGRCWDELGEERFEDAERSCRRAIELDPSHQTAWNNLGQALAALGRPQEAETALRRQLEIVPNDAYAYSNLGRLARDRGDFVEAERLMRQQVEVAPLGPYGYRQLGFLLERQGRLDEAESSFERALKLDPEDEWTRKQLFHLWAKGDRCEPMLEALLSGKVSFPDFHDRVVASAAVLNAACSPLAPAAPWFQRLRADSEDALSGLELGSGPLDSPDRETLTAVGALAMAWDGAGRIALESGDAETAERWFAGAFSLSPTPAMAASRAGAQKALGNPEGARRFLAIGAALGGRGSATASAELAREVPAAAERARFEGGAAEESWRIRSLFLDIPPAAGANGAVWLLLGADGRLVSALPDEGTAVPGLREAIGTEPLLAVPPGNRARILRRATVACDSVGHCALIFEWPFQTAQALAAR